MGKQPRGVKKLHEAKLLGCLLKTDNEKIAKALTASMDHAQRRYVQPVVEAALAGIRELDVRGVREGVVIKLVDGMLTVHVADPKGDRSSTAVAVALDDRLPTNTDPPGE